MATSSPFALPFRFRSSCLAAVLLCVPAGSAAGQSSYPDLVMTWYDYVQYPTMNGLDLVRIADYFPQPPGPVFPSPLLMRLRWSSWGIPGKPAIDVDNDSILLPWSDGHGSVLYRVAPSLAITSVYGNAISDVLVAPSGGYLFGVAGGLARIRRDGSGFQMLMTTPFPPRNLGIDQDSGDMICLGYGRLCRLGLTGGTITTLAALNSRGDYWVDVDYDHVTGDYLAATSVLGGSLSGQLMRIPRQGGTPVTETRIGGASGWLRVAQDGSVYSASWLFARLTRDGAGGWTTRVLDSFVTPPGWHLGSGYQGIALRHSRTLAGEGTYSPGSSYSLLVSFLGEGGSLYQGAASLSIRPGIRLGSHWLPLNPDAVFLASLTLPQVFTNFTGTLTGAGRATATFNIPPFEALRGLRVFFAFVTLGAGGVRSVSNLLGVTIGADL